MDMTREQFMELFNLGEYDEGMVFADEDHENGKSWFEIAKATIAQMVQCLLD